MKKEIILSGNCSWTLEAVFLRIKNVLKVVPGVYNISDYDVAFSKKDKLEVVLVSYESDFIDLKTILDLHFFSHTPTVNPWDINNCFYPLCRSSIISNDKKEISEIKNYLIDKQKEYEELILTKVLQYKDLNFTIAEEKNINYFSKNPKDGYCQSLIVPKIEKLKTQFPLLYKEPF